MRSAAAANRVGFSPFLSVASARPPYWTGRVSELVSSADGRTEPAPGRGSTVAAVPRPVGALPAKSVSSAHTPRRPGKRAHWAGATGPTPAVAPPQHLT